ncbi:hypothetical protein XF36_23065 [Pseudonocardia sp. HH130629-09]|nr:hypothetical protein XF36_23065 [Pseudonocardia sp. HH130629-09]
MNGLDWPDLVADLFTRAEGSDRIAVKGWLLNRYFPEHQRDTNRLYVIDRNGHVVPPNENTAPCDQDRTSVR